MGIRQEERSLGVRYPAAGRVQAVSAPRGCARSRRIWKTKSAPLKTMQVSIVSAESLESGHLPGALVLGA